MTTWIPAFAGTAVRGVSQLACHSLEHGSQYQQVVGVHGQWRGTGLYYLRFRPAVGDSLGSWKI